LPSMTACIICRISSRSTS
ncbi:hypothetical protein CP061683_1444B, partial [Chlamydia psittaci 06-1683]